MASPPGDSYDSHARKRVGKACDRCRLKKSKCDGSYPCSRCKMDNAICAFGDRKRSQDRVFPKGYPEMLEFQQGQIVTAVRKMYTMLLREGKWPGAPLKEIEGHPLTHDILETLGILEEAGESPVGTPPTFEDDLHSLQQRVASLNRSDSSSKGHKSIHSDTDSEHHESPLNSPSSRTASVSSSISGRKRSPSSASPYSSMAELPTKHVKYEESSPSKHVPQLPTAPFVVGTDYTISPTFDFSNVDTTAYETDNFQLYNPLQYPLQLGTSGFSSIPNFENFGTLALDPDYQTFQHSGLHSFQTLV